MHSCGLKQQTARQVDARRQTDSWAAYYIEQLDGYANSWMAMTTMIDVWGLDSRKTDRQTDRRTDRQTDRRMLGNSWNY